jgi:CTP synthase
MLTDHVKNKIAQFGNLKPEDVITGIDVDDVYKIPLIFEEQGMSQLLARKLNISIKPRLSELERLVLSKENATKNIDIAIAGKYTSLEDSYASIIESLKHCSAHLETKINIKWVETARDFDLNGISGVIVPGGFGSRGVEGKIEAVKYCRENKIPFLGICYGLQMAVIEFARNVCGLTDANTTEVNPKTPHPVVHILETQKEITEKGGTMRLGSYRAKIKDSTKIYSLYGSNDVAERHRHRYEVNQDYHKILLENGMTFSGMSPDGTLVEFIELENHPYFVATQAHPELKSNLLKPAPMFKGLVEAAIKYKDKSL